MLSSIDLSIDYAILYLTHLYCNFQNNRKCTVLGAGGGIGQPLSLLMKLNPSVTELNLFDIVPFTPGVAADISHIDTPAHVKGFTGPEQLVDSLRGQ